MSFDKPALMDVSLRVAPGEMILVTGVSGSGKSVLLRLAIGLLKPDSGQIFINGQEIDALDEAALLMIRGGQMGMVFQEDSLFTGLTVYENAAYRLEEHGWSEERIEQAVTEVLRFVGLDGDQDRLPEELSGGMKRRLEIARALIGWPSIMLFDEPTMGLDPIVASQVLNLIIRDRDINQSSSLYVTKKLYEIPYLGGYHAVGGSSAQGTSGELVVSEASADDLPKTRVILLDAGTISFEGTVTEFQNSDLPAIQELVTLEHHEHSNDQYFPDPWDKKRRPREEIL